MKKIALAVGVILAIFLAACDGNQTEKVSARPAADSTATSCNIRFIDVDSVLLSYTLAQELIAEQQKEMNALESARRQKESELQRLGNSIQSKAQNNGYLSEQSYNSDVQDLQRRAQEADQWLGNHQERLARLVASQQMRLNDSLQNFLKDFNEVYNYDAILDKKAGFFKPELDITGEVIEGLNARYNPVPAEK